MLDLQSRRATSLNSCPGCLQVLALISLSQQQDRKEKEIQPSHEKFALHSPSGISGTERTRRSSGIHHQQVQGIHGC